MEILAETLCSHDQYREAASLYDRLALKSGQGQSSLERFVSLAKIARQAASSKPINMHTKGSHSDKDASGLQAPPCPPFWLTSLLDNQ